VTVSELRPWIEKLNGLTVVEIRDLLVDEGVKGHRDDDNDCPLATFLRAKGVEQPSVTVYNTIDLSTVSIDDNEDELSVDHGESVSEFISRFDAGEFAELLTPSPYAFS
jgi:hypothetical protein